MYKAWSRWYSDKLAALYFSFWPMVTACAVPVLPALVYPAPANTRAEVPDVTTPTKPLRMTSMCSGL